MFRTSSLHIHLLLIPLFVTLLAGCGSKGPVKPLLGDVQGKVGNVSLLQRGEVMQLSWTSPRKNEDGSKITALSGYNIYRWVHPQNTFCEECRDESVLWRVVDAEYPENVVVDGDSYTIFDFDTVLNGVHRYRIHPVAGGGIEGKPVKIVSAFLTPYSAPYVEVTVLEGAVRIVWQPFAEETETIAGFRVYRQQEDSLTSLPLFEKPIEDNAYDDLRVESGVRYLYSVRAVDLDGNEGLSSETIEVVVP